MLSQKEILPTKTLRLVLGLAKYFWISMVGYIVAQETGPFELGLSLVGRGRLFVDGKLVLDNGVDNKQTPGPSFYGTFRVISTTRTV